jgi:hypothetical protein
MNVKEFLEQNKDKKIIAVKYKGVVYNIFSIHRGYKIINAYLEDEITEDIFYEFAFEELEEDEKLEFYQMSVVNDNKKDFRYMSFDFSDGECKHYPIIVRINKFIDVDIMKEIDNATQNKMNEYIEKEEYWDCDDILVDEVMKTFAEKYNFTYEFVEMSYCVDCN